MKPEVISSDSQEFAIIIRAEYKNPGISFFTPNNYSQQLGFMTREKGYEVEPHIHKKIKREVFTTQEVLFIKSGKVRIDFYEDVTKKLHSSTVLNKGDTILLASGGHGLSFLENSEVIEVKQGPYTNDDDKVRF